NFAPLDSRRRPVPQPTSSRESPAVRTPSSATVRFSRWLTAVSASYRGAHSGYPSRAVSTSTRLALLRWAVRRRAEMAVAPRIVRNALRQLAPEAQHAGVGILAPFPPPAGQKSPHCLAPRRRSRVLHGWKPTLEHELEVFDFGLEA